MPKLTYALLVTLAATACAQGSEIGAGGFGGGTLTSGKGPGSSGPGSSMQTNTQASQNTATTPATQVSSTSEATDASSATTGEPCSEMPCKLVEPQCGCEDTRQCSIDGTGMRACVPKGTVAVGLACDQDNECAPGAMCVGLQNVSHCLEFCENDAQCAGGGGRCVITLNNGGVPIPGVTMCSENCDSINATGCPTPGTGCTPALDDNMMGFTVCIDAGTAGDLAPCPTNFECAPGFGCINLGGSPVCLHWCDVNQGACSVPGTTCGPLNPPLIVNGVNYGVCN